MEAASIDTQNKLRDTHLRSATFFDVKTYPTITFTSTYVEHVGGRNYKVTGNLTMRGVTKPITFDVEYRAWSEHDVGRSHRPRREGSDQSRRFWRGPERGGADRSEFDSYHRD